MKHSIITIIATIICQSSFASQQVTAEYLETTELVSIVSHLAGIPGYDWGKDQTLCDYVAKVDSVFAPYRDHRVVNFMPRYVETINGM